MNIKEIVTKYLTDNGLDGFGSEACSCALPDIMPCSSMDGVPAEDCEAGTKCPCPEDCGCGEFHIRPEVKP